MVIMVGQFVLILLARIGTVMVESYSHKDS